MVKKKGSKNKDGAVDIKHRGSKGYTVVEVKSMQEIYLAYILLGMGELEIDEKGDCACHRTRIEWREDEVFARILKATKENSASFILENAKSDFSLAWDKAKDGECSKEFAKLAGDVMSHARWMAGKINQEFADSKPKDGGISININMDGKLEAAQARLDGLIEVEVIEDE